jgi:hypothetical protein
LLADCTELVKMLKQTALDAVDAKKPAAVYYGTVLSAAPLKIDVEQKMTLSQAQLVLTRAVVDHYVDIEVKHETEDEEGGTGAEAYEKHKHKYKGRKKIMIYNGLKPGERVIIIRFQEGQKFLVVDRVCDHTVEGQWL